ncbi:P-loop containing nucleoside triphosphate hydrolase protein [Amanita muscaria]
MVENRVCRYFFSEGGCRPARRGCRFRHDAFKCPCGVLVLDSFKNDHEKGKKHRQFTWQQRQTGAPTAADDEEEEEEDTVVMLEEDKTEKCPRCQRILFAVDMDGHIAEHERQDRIRQMEEELAKAELDKEDITVDSKEGIHFGVIEVGTAEKIKLNIRRIEGQGPSVQLINCFMCSSLQKDDSTSPFTASGIGRRLNVTTKRPLSVDIVFIPSYDGYHEDTLELVFAHSRGTQFVITRRVYGTAGSWEDHEELKPKGPYKKKKKYVPLAIEGKVFPSTRPPVWTGIRWVNIMPKFDPPQKLIRAAFKPNEAASRKAVKRFMPKDFNIETYGDWYQILLYIEGEQRQRELDVLYMQENAQLVGKSLKYELTVKGVADGRPSVLVGDYIHARKSGGFQNEDDAWYTGRVHAINGDVISLYFSDEFSHIRGTTYNIRFIYNRVPERRKHQAVTGSYKPMRALFPDKSHIQYGRVTSLEMEAIDVFNRDIEDNYQQWEAVATICKQPPGSVPFIIFGPPGTGKTVTMVEAIRQVLLRNPDARILACAPSNTAADTLAAKLMTLGESQLFRLNSLARPPKDLRSGLKSFSLINDNKIFAIPTKEELQKYRAIVSTRISAGVLWGIGFRKGHFTHIFIDEAGQGQEPDIMVPFLSLADDTTNLVLAGDHQQLGPSVNSQIATSYGLATSYLQRMMDREIYDDEDYGRGLTVVKLLQNFRSHPSILEFSNRHFYKFELIPSGDPMITHSLQNVEELPTKQFPIIFEGIIGKDQREETSPSFFNIDEVTVVKRYCQMLTLYNRKYNIRTLLRPHKLGAHS